MRASVENEFVAPQNDGSRADRVAVILNKNAKRVGPKVRQRVEAALPSNADIFYTESLEQARFIIRRIVDSGYQTLVTGGGDGTVVNTIDEALKHRDERGYAHCPRFAVLKLGTGNAIADFLGAGTVQDDLGSLDAAPVRWMDLINVNGRRTTFAGFGWDAHILNNYDRMRESAERFSPTRALFKTVGGYLVAGLGKSVPEFILQRPSWKVKVINTGGIGLELDGDGNVIRRIAPGAVAYEGSVKMGCFGTTPYYGYKMNIMPFADRTSGMMHLRLVDINPMRAVASLREIWSGDFKHPGCHDFQLSGCQLEFEEEIPFQVAGDAAGEVKSLEIKMDHPVRCANFN